MIRPKFHFQIEVVWRFGAINKNIVKDGEEKANWHQEDEFHETVSLTPSVPSRQFFVEKNAKSY